MQPQVESKVSVAEHPDVTREKLMATLKKVAALQRIAASTNDLMEKAETTAQAAVLNKQASKMAEKLGLTNMPSLKKGAQGKPSGPAPVRFMPTDELTVENVLTLAAAGRVTPEGAAALSEVPKGPVAVKAWVPPPFPPLPDAASVAAFFAPAKTMSPAAPVLRSPKDPFFKKEGGLKNFATVQQPPQYVGQDGEWIALLQQLPPAYADDRARVLELLQRAVSENYVGSGPLEGWFLRIMAGDSRPHPEFTLSPEEARAVLQSLPWDKARVPTFKEMDLIDVLRRVRVNPSAGAGMPRQKKKGEVLKEVLEDAAQYYALMSKKEFVAYQKLHPGEFLTIAKAKHDRYEVADWGKKIRPYYNMNGGMAVLYSAVIQAYSGALLGFWEDDNSCNAHGFAWNNGGGQRLYDWVASRKQKGPGLHAIGYSDDGLWVIVDEAGNTLISDKDVAQMDTSCGNSHLPMVREHVTAVLAEALTDGWANVKNAAVAAIFKQLVLLYKSLVYFSHNKIHSGIPGTAEADQVALATAKVILTNAYNASKAATPQLRFEEAEGVLERRTGLKFKPSKWYTFLPGAESYPWQFLGKRLARFRGQYIPIVDEYKAIVQLVTPKKNAGGTEGQRAWMERARGLAVTSLYWYPHLFVLAKEAFERKRKLGIMPAPTFDGLDADSRDLDQILGYGVTVVFPEGGDFPKWEWVMALYTGSMAKHTPQPGAPPSPVVVAKFKSAADYFDEYEPEGSDKGAASWADTVPDTEARINAQKPLVETQRIPPVEHLPVVAGPAQYQLAPLPEVVKRAYHDARMAYIRRVSAEAPTKKKGGYVRGGAVERLEQSERTVVFTKEGITEEWTKAYKEDFEFTDPAFYDDSDWVEYAKGEESDEAWGRRMERESTDQIEKVWSRAERRRAGSRPAKP